MSIRNLSIPQTSNSDEMTVEDPRRKSSVGTLTMTDLLTKSSKPQSRTRRVIKNIFITIGIVVVCGVLLGSLAVFLLL
jgi:hypothetical protein